MPTESLPRRLWAAIARTTPGVDGDSPASSGASDHLRSAVARTPEATGMAKARSLMTEDHADYERTVDLALNDPELHAMMEARNCPLSPEQLRTMAMNATALITAPAATEYRAYVTLRERERVAQGRAELSEETAGAGAAAIVAVLFPVLAGALSVLLLVSGYVLRLVSSWSVSDLLITGGWIFGALTAVSIVIASVGLLLTALRNADASAASTSEEVARARAAWQEALLERGIRVFLRAAVDPDT
ncbi:membrane protein [Streptomyces phaeofaciens JCM 4814]|uniref:Membrane protein n=1 Tax=Streptomyces phaeofaciens TaxID=68254 RepID=A0A918HJQ5_9ACTN|nr:hypothetical protein [Streptomyces phaeofaciens]GGT70107.1 membrane protein [Streptomyces phaeofaciens]